MSRIVIILALALCATAAGVLAQQMKGGSDVETIDVLASRFQFDPVTISVAQGDIVRLRLRSADRAHAFAIKAFRVNAMIPKKGEAISLEFLADRAGTFEFACAEYCGTGHARMKGRLVVRPSHDAADVPQLRIDGP